MALVPLRDESTPSALTIQGNTALIFRQNLGPGTLLHQIYSDVGERLAKRADQIAQHLGLGPEAITQHILEAFGDKDQTLSKLVELYRSRKYKAVVPWTLPVAKYCIELVHYTLRSEASETRLQAFNCIIKMITFYPGLRQLLLLSKDLRRARESQEGILGLWECDGPCSKEWEYKRRLAATLLSEDEIGNLVETTRPKGLGYVDSDGSGSVIEKLLSIIDCERHSNSISGRYSSAKYFLAQIPLPKSQFGGN
ncbi:hypothetical protein BDZ94DRAFT_91849 [Collybia nuda]|uniref:Uncharacterized protein n=1 Tax=Collybia nuda TaxID=64659 RepID=A0A9P5YCV3_9AGAR|nr:hypothetical protein BDZ94DRAFT_91849 [Collybia nuda]